MTLDLSLSGTVKKKLCFRSHSAFEPLACVQKAHCNHRAGDGQQSKHEGPTSLEGSAAPQKNGCRDDHRPRDYICVYTVGRVSFAWRGLPWPDRTLQTVVVQEPFRLGHLAGPLPLMGNIGGRVHEWPSLGVSQNGCILQLAVQGAGGHGAC